MKKEIKSNNDNENIMDAKKRAVSKLQSSKSKASLFRDIKIISIRHSGKIPKKICIKC